MGKEEITQVLDEYLIRRRRGENPSVEEYIERYPQYADELRKTFKEELGWMSKFNTFAQVLKIKISRDELNLTWEKFEEKQKDFAGVAERIPLWRRRKEGIMPEYYLGIDLGTTNSSICVYRQGRPEILNVEGEPILPSVVYFKNGTPIVGKQAKSMMMIDPEHTIVSVKRNMGVLNSKYKINGREYTPADISSMILEKLVEAARQELGPVRKAVISVPAYFNDDQTAATKKAAQKAGLEVLRLISEPTAAAIAYGLNQGKDQTIVVYDMGGGTFDVSILQVKGNTFTVKAVGGDYRLGGDDFDRALSDYAKEKFSESSGIDLRKEPKSKELLSALQRLKQECETRKIELTDAIEATINVPNIYKGKHLNVPVSRGTFEDLIEDKVYKTKQIVERTLESAGLICDEIDRVILVGGSTQIPLVRKVVTNTIKEPYVAPNVMEIVAHGAGIVAGSYLTIDKGETEQIKEIKALKGITTIEKYPYCLGIAVVDWVPAKEAHRFFDTLQRKGDRALVEGAFAQLIERMSDIPVKRTRGGFSTVYDYEEEVLIQVFRGREESDSCVGMDLLGDFRIKVQREKAGVPQIEVTFDIDNDRILEVIAVDRAVKEPGGIKVPILRDTSRVVEEIPETVYL